MKEKNSMDPLFIVEINAGTYNAKACFTHEKSFNFALCPPQHHQNQNQNHWHYSLKRRKDEHHKITVNKYNQ